MKQLRKALNPIMSSSNDQDNIERIVAENPDFPPKGSDEHLVDMSHLTLHMLGHAHIDLGYRWDFKETVHRIAPDTFRAVLDLMEQAPDFTFCQSQMYLYKAMEMEYPEIFRRIRQHIDKGNWEVIGGAWCEFDTILPSGESIIRQYLMGVKYASERLGVSEHTVAFVPDSFIAHAATLPQILNGCGFKYYLFGRGLPKEKDPEKTKRSFRWIGPDGSSLIAYLPFGPYSNPPLTRERLKKLAPYMKAGVSKEELALYGAGDHGGGPRYHEIETLHSMKDIPEAPKWKFGKASEFFPKVFSRQVRNRLRDHRGNLHAFATGALTSQAQIKRENRCCDRELLRAEAACAAAAILQRKPAYPRLDFQGLWQELLVYQFHDILPGTSSASVYRAARESYRDIHKKARFLLGDSLSRIKSRIDTRGDGYPLMVFNPGLESYRGIVSVELPPWISSVKGKLSLFDPDKKEVQAHWEEDSNGRRLSFVGRIPPLSYRIYRAYERISGLIQTDPPRFKDNVLESDYFRLVFDPSTGDLLKLQDKGRELDLLKDRSNTLEILEEHEMSTSWVQAFTGGRRAVVMEEKPGVSTETVFSTTVTTTSSSKWSRFTREVTVYNGLPRIDFRLLLSWHESNAFLKIGFQPGMDNPKIKTSIPHGSVIVDDPAAEFCMHDWLDLDDGRFGLALFNDGAYGADFVDGKIRLSVIRTARDMDPEMSYGNHELNYSLFPHERGLVQSVIVHEAGSFLGRAICAWDTEHPGGVKSWGRIDNTHPLPAEKSFVSIDADNVALCAVKIPEEYWTPDALIVRLRECDGIAAPCNITFPLEPDSAARCDHLERSLNKPCAVSGNRVKVAIKPYEIVTVMVYL
jgi:alpha-mannosidase